MKKHIGRREFVKTVGAAAAALAVGCARIPRTTGETAPKKRTLRIAHLTDIHLQPERDGEKWLTWCLHHVQNLDDKPDIIFNSGDMIMDSLGADFQRTKIQWDLWKKVWKNECSLPVEHCLGNHDVWGWNRKESGATGKEPLYGKKYALEVLGLKRRFRSFQKSGWFFIFLDSTHPHEEDVYTAKLDEDQFQWLSTELARVQKHSPVCIFSHIPILSGSVFFDGKNEKTGNWVVPHRWMHIDARRLKDLFLKHPNVRLCLSGHVHLKDRVDYNGVTYLCNGAVCGGWWKRSYQETPPGYALVNLYDDGSFDREYVTYGWKGEEKEVTFILDMDKVKIPV